VRTRQTTFPCARRSAVRCRRGVALIYVAVALLALLAVASLALDYGRAQLARTELQSCADAASRATAWGIPNGLAGARTRGKNLAAFNKAGGAPVVLEDADFRFGRWNYQTGQLENATPSQINAVEVTAKRTVSLAFATLIGKSEVDVAARATGLYKPPTSYAIVGLDGIIMHGNLEVDSYDSALGGYSSGSRRQNGDIATNGSVALSENAKVYGDAEYRANFTTQDNAEVVSPGIATRVATNISGPPVTLPGGYTNMGNLNGSNGTMTLTAGTYFFTGIKTSGNFVLNVVGKVTIYVDGNVDLAGQSIVYTQKAADFEINVMNGGNVKLAGQGALYADVYAPTSAVTVAGNGHFYGRILGKTVDGGGNGKIHFDEALAPNTLPSVAMVN